MAQTLSIKTQRLQARGMDCGGCAKTLEASLQQLSGVTETLVSFATGRLRVQVLQPLLQITASIRATACKPVRLLVLTRQAEVNNNHDQNY